MSDTRKKALAYLEKKLGYKTGDPVSASRFFPPEKSWTGREAWWFNLPIKKIRANGDKCYYLLGATNEKKVSFAILKVPNKFLLGKLKQLETRYNNMVILHLAAYRKNWLVDERGKGRVAFSRFEMKGTRRETK